MLSPSRITILLSISCLALVQSWTPISTIRNNKRIQSNSNYKTQLHIFGTKEETTETTTTTKSSSETPTVEETTEAYGLEAGLFQSLKQNDGGQSAKDLLAKYGFAYLATSIPLAIVSFTICYVLVDSGVDVSGLLGKIGIEVNESGEKVGTFAIAYAAHKAASPIRFPPTVLLTPVVAKMIGKEPTGEGSVDEEDA